MIRNILCVAYRYLLGKSGCVTTNTFIDGLPRLTSHFSWSTRTIPSNLSFWNLFGNLPLTRSEGKIIREVTDAFDPYPGWSCATSGIAFHIFCDFCDFAKYQVACAGWSELSCILDLNQTKSCPDSSIHEEYPCQTAVSDLDIQHELGKTAWTTNYCIID